MHQGDTVGKQKGNQLPIVDCSIQPSRESLVLHQQGNNRQEGIAPLNHSTYYQRLQYLSKTEPPATFFMLPRVHVTFNS